MIEQGYDFSKLASFLDRKFVHPSDCIDILETIENALTNLEQVVNLNREIVVAIDYFEELKLAIDAAIPTDKRRL